MFIIVGCYAPKQKDLNPTEWASYNFCNSMQFGRCFRNSVTCNTSIDDSNVTSCTISYTINIPGGTNYGIFSCRCKNLVCEYESK